MPRLSGVIQPGRDLHDGKRLVLKIDRAARRIDRQQVLLEDRLLAAGDVEDGTVRAGMAVAMPAGHHGALDLHDRLPARGRCARREREIVVADGSPAAVGDRAVAGLVPPLDEVVMHVARRRPGQLGIDVVKLPFRAGVPRNPVGPARRVDPADEGDLGRLAGIDQPALLVVAAGSLVTVPADAETRSAPMQHLAIIRRSGKGRAEAHALGIGTPEDGADVEPARGRAIEQVEQRSPAVGHPEAGIEEGDRHPDAVLCRAASTAAPMRRNAGTPSTSGVTAFPARAG